MANFNRFDIGGCNCSPCLPCALPAATLHLNWSYFDGTSTFTGILALPYSGIVGGRPTWQSACAVTGSTVPSKTHSFKFAIQCQPSISGGIAFTTYTASGYSSVGGVNATCTGAVGINNIYDTSGETGSGTLVSHTCSPLNIVIAVGSIWTWTITP